MDRRPQSRFPDVRHHDVASDSGADHWATIASLIETCKLNGVDPQDYLADIFASLVESHPINRIDELLPWNWAAARQARRAA